MKLFNYVERVYLVILFIFFGSAFVNLLPQEQPVQPFVELIKAGDDVFLAQGFKLSKETKLNILSVGEGTEKELYDYGWIIDADTREVVWTMKMDETQNAGGAEKNRIVQTKTTLNAGNYIAYYTTDGSHSYFDWNDTAPDNKERWGLTIWTSDKSDRSSVALFDAENYKSENVIAEIVRVGDNDFESKEFILDKDTKIKIYSLGEGTRGGMADYGWIEDESTGKTLWSMTYKKSEHAGGASKNRKAVEIVSLPKGKYRVYYETDPSHSYKDWNANPPDDQERYGITLMYDKSASLN